MQTNFSSVTKSLSLTELDNLQAYKPIAQELAKIQGSDAQASDFFGHSVAVSDTRIVVSAKDFFDTNGSTGAYIFDIDGNQIAKVQPSVAQAEDQFGESVAVSNNRIVVGAPRETTAGPAYFAGTVYIFDINGNQLAKIQGSDTEAYDGFGESVAVSNNRIVVGAKYEDTTAGDAGSVYIFDIDGNQIAKIQASDAQASDSFGWSVAVSDTRIVVSAPTEDTGGTNTGSVYIFDIDGNQLAKIQGSDTEEFDEFGRSVAVSDTRIVVGTLWEDTTWTDSGSAYIFDIDGNQIAKIRASDPQYQDYFGTSVAVSNNRIVVGAPTEDTTASGAGSVYIFDINGNQIAKIQASDAQASDLFGRSVAASNTRIVIGARGEDTTASNAGSAYIFTPGFSSFGDLCAYYDLGDPTVLDTNFSWSNYT